MKDHHMSLAHQRRYVAALSMYLLLLVGAVFGQTPGTGAVSGVVYDPSNHVVVNAEVLAVNEATHVSRSVMTTTEGMFRVPLLPPGTYSVTVNAPGFAANTSRSIPVTVSETTSLNVTLAIAGVAQSAQVKGNAAVAELESSTLGGLINDKAIQSLPLSSRNYTQILGLSPGVVVDLPNATALGNGTQNVASNGATPTANNIQFNGIDANNLAENSAANCRKRHSGSGHSGAGHDPGVSGADGELRCGIWTRDRRECRSGQQERNEQVPRKRMGVSAQQHLQCERFLFET